MRIIGLTGGVASGKSLVLNLFLKLGAYVIDCDMLSREVVRPHSKAWWEIVKFFGESVLRKDLELDRRKLREIVFSDSDFEKKKKKILEGIIHPEVRRECMERIEAIKRLNQKALVVIDVPLLIEIGIQKEFDKVIVVYAREEMQIRRVMKRDGITKEEAKLAINAQMPLKEKLKFADFVINNEGTQEETEEQVRKIYKYINPRE